MEKAQKRLELIRQALNKLWEKAKEDGVVTEDEKAIIDAVTESLEVYESVFDKAVEDNIITPEERNELLDLEEKMYSDSYFTAMRDNILTEEEALLLKTLMLTINPKSDVSWLDVDLKKNE